MDGDSYDGLSSRLVQEPDLQAFLLACFEVTEGELFISHADRTSEALASYPPGGTFAVHCTYDRVSGDFSMSFNVSIQGHLAAKIRRQEFMRRFAERFNTHVLYGDTEPMDVWSLTLPDGTHLHTTMNEEDDQFILQATTAPVPGLRRLRKLHI